MSEDIKKSQVEGEVADEQLEEVSGGLSGRFEEEFREGLGNKGLTGRFKEEFEEGLGNKGLTGRFKEEFEEGLGNKDA